MANNNKPGGKPDPSKNISSQPKVDGYKLEELIGKGTYGQVYKAEKRVSMY